METKLFLDTNIIFDIIDISRPNTGNVRKMFYLSEEKHFSFYVSAVTVNTIVYVMQNRFKMKPSHLKNKLEKLLQVTEIVPYDSEIITDGLSLNFKDVEDSFQFISALRCRADYLITEDTGLLKEIPQNDKIRAMNTSDFLKSFPEQRNK